MLYIVMMYVVMCVLVMIGIDEVCEVIVGVDLRVFLLFLKDSRTGGFRVYEGGESDTRGCYVVLVIVYLCGVFDEELMCGVSLFVVSC